MNSTRPYVIVPLTTPWLSCYIVFCWLASVMFWCAMLCTDSGDCDDVRELEATGFLLSVQCSPIFHITGILQGSQTRRDTDNQM